MTEWFKVIDCKSIDIYHHRFESCHLQKFQLFFLMKRTRKNLKAVVKKKKKVPLRFRKNYFLKKRLFLRFYRHEIYIRPQSNNLFLNTFFSGLSQNSYKLSAGLLHDYKKKKKKVIC